MRKKDLKFKASQAYMARHCLKKAKIGWGDDSVSKVFAVKVGGSEFGSEAPGKKPGSVAHNCSSSPRGGRGRKVPGIPWPPTAARAPGSVRVCLQHKTKMEIDGGKHLARTSGLYMNTHEHAHMQTQKQQEQKLLQAGRVVGNTLPAVMIPCAVMIPFLQ